jgi:hypothetical protein
LAGAITYVHRLPKERIAADIAAELDAAVDVVMREA